MVTPIFATLILLCGWLAQIYPASLWGTILAPRWESRLAVLV